MRLCLLYTSASANSLIDKNKYRIKKELIATLPDREKVICCHCNSTDEEARWIADEIERIHKDGRAYKDITVLYRAHYITRSIEEVFMDKKIPYIIYSGIQFFSRKEIKDVISYMRMLAYRDDLSFLRIIKDVYKRQH